MPFNIGYKADVPTTQEFIPGVHEGLDSCGPVGCPLFAPARSRVLEVVRVGQSSRRFGASSSGVYVALLVLGNRDATEVVTVQKHLASLVVVDEGQVLEAGDHIGYQGWTGYVLPAGPGGEHCHQDVFVNMVRKDPTPFFIGGQSLILDPAPVQPTEEDTTVAKLPFPIQYEYTDSDRLAIHSEISLDPATDVGGIYPGDLVNVDAIANAYGHTWGHSERGWFSMGKDRIWFKPVIADDRSAEITQLQTQLEVRTQERDCKQDQLERIRQIIG